MSNNLPLYPLLRRERNVDIIVCFDASADIKQENWLSVAEGYAKQRGVRGWPAGAGWPSVKDESRAELDAADAATAQQAAGKIAETREAQRGKLQNKAKDHIAKSQTDKSGDTGDVGYCSGTYIPEHSLIAHTGTQVIRHFSGFRSPPPSTDAITLYFDVLLHSAKELLTLNLLSVWVGTTKDHKEPPQSTRVEIDADWKLLAPDAGITVVYFPLLRNPEVEDIDPDTSPFLSTWNFIYSPQEIDKVVALARANFEAGRDQTKGTVRAVYERKKARRLEAEEKENIQRWMRHLREHGDYFQ